MTEVQLVPLKSSDRESFIKDNQEAFNYGALEEFGLRDVHFEDKNDEQITDITELLGSMPTFYRRRCAMISADTPAGRVKLFSEPLAMESEFTDSSLFPVWQALLERFSALTPVQKSGQITDFWYKKQ